jgi:hypothetical protein
MRHRFKKVWCSECKTMQFAGECGHARQIEPPTLQKLRARVEERGARSLQSWAPLAMAPSDSSAVFWKGVLKYFGFVR